MQRYPVARLQTGNILVLQRRLKPDRLIHGLVKNAGWKLEDAENHFNHYAPMFEIGSEIEFVLREVKRLRLNYPKIIIAPLLYKVEDNRLYFIKEK